MARHLSRLATFCPVAACIAALLSGSVAGAQQGNVAAGAPFPTLAREFVLTTLAFSPTTAMSAGLHEWTAPDGNRVALDTLLDDLSLAEVARERRYYVDVRRRLHALRRASLDAQTRVDYDLVTNAIASALFSIDTERFNESRPQSYAELAGNALFLPMALEYADQSVRASHLTARLAQLPAFLRTARRTLKSTNEVYGRIALEEADGVASLISAAGVSFVRGTPSAARYASVSAPALAAIAEYKAFVRDTLPGLGHADWRMGSEKYARKWTLYLQVSRTPAEMLALARDSVRAARREMLDLAKPLHAAWFPTHDHHGPDDARLNAVVGEVMKRIGDEHGQRDSLLEQGARNVLFLQDVVARRHLLSVDTIPNLRVIPTPEFQRGSYGVAGAVFAPVLQPDLFTFYWVTPIPATWSPARADSKLHEYNDYKMLDLTIHEVIPGHVTQGTYANRITPEWRRLLRSTAANNASIEGWAVYAEHVMMYDGHVDGGDPVKMRLTDLKGMLRVYVNAIIDIGLHTRNMPGDSAVALMMRDAFQERPEAEAKLQRAQLDYVQLENYLAGVVDWTAFRLAAERQEGRRFSLCRFHDTVLLHGPLPVPIVRRLYFDRVPPSAAAPPSRCGPPAP